MKNTTTARAGRGNSRREFIKGSVVGAAAAAAPDVARSAHVSGSDQIRVALIGCGGRGTGAATQAVNGGPGVKLVALADMFPDRLQRSRKLLQQRISDKMEVPPERCFVGFDAYKQAIGCGVDLVLLCTPPHFRPVQLQAAVEAGKHIFAEKPVAVDAPGVRSVLGTVEEARKRNLAIVSGLCWRYDYGVRETIKRVQDGAIGRITALQCNYNTGYLRKVERQPGWSDMEWQLRNWLYFTWLSGDHIVEQHIHSLDKMAWVMGDQYPVKAWGLGGRQVRVEPVYGNIFDHHAVQYEFANGVRLFSYCRQIRGCANDVNDYIFGATGSCNVLGHLIKNPKGDTVWRRRPRTNNMYQTEHEELIASIRAGKPINNGLYMAHSTLMAIMGRMATYTGQAISWQQALNSKQDLSPAKYEFGPLPVRPVARPGLTKFA